MIVSRGFRFFSALLAAAAFFGMGSCATPERPAVELRPSLQAIVLPPVASEDSDYEPGYEAGELDLRIRMEAKRVLENLGYRVVLANGRYPDEKGAARAPADARLEITVVDLMTEYQTQPYMFDIEARARLVDLASGEVLWRGEGRGHREDFGQPLGLIYFHKERALAIVDMLDWLLGTFPDAR